MVDKNDDVSLNDALDLASAKVNQLAAMVQVLANDEGRRDWDINTEACYLEACADIAVQAKSAVGDMYQFV